ncbi:MAG TPA: M23 family metallopeptidase [Egibacteraceae bacterium]|nr:M23 family metallopeptidase [Egibacteraceae bacterium]
MNRRLRGPLELSSLIVGLAAALIGLRWLGPVQLLALPAAEVDWWLRSTSPADTVAAFLHVVALGCAIWLLAGTLLYVLARLSCAPGAIRAVEWSLPPALRKIIDRGLAAALAGSAAIAAPAAALEPPPLGWTAPPQVTQSSEPLAARWIESDARGRKEMGSLQPSPSPAGRSQAIAPGPGAVILPAGSVDPPGGAPAAARAPGSDEHEVRPGESLWSIAADAVAGELGRPASQLALEDVRRRWRTVIADNLAHLRSGDPDLIFPGDRVTLRTPDDPDVQPRQTRFSSSALLPPAARYALPVAREHLSVEHMSRLHHDYPAWDLPLPVGTPVSAVHGGQVVAVTSSASRCGNGVVIDGHDGHRYTYCHAERVTVTSGESVSAGQLIFLSGSSGNSTGPHLHLGIATASGRAICPQPLVQAWHAGRQTAPSELTTTACV